jgi:hypothetical protein
MVLSKQYLVGKRHTDNFFVEFWPARFVRSFVLFPPKLSTLDLWVAEERLTGSEMIFLDTFLSLLLISEQHPDLDLDPACV